MAAMKSSVKLLVLTGLALGAVLGMAGTFVPSANLRSIFWAIDGTGLIIATVLLGLHFFRQQNDLLAAGFLIYAIGESIMHIGNATTLEGSIPSFAAGTALWSAALMLVSAPRGLALWNRIVGVVASILFAAVALQIFWGATLTPLSRPLPFAAYPFLVLNFIGWGICIARQPHSATETRAVAPQSSAA
jgi:hypothetical protein